MVENFIGQDKRLERDDICWPSRRMWATYISIMSLLQSVWLVIFEWQLINQDMEWCLGAKKSHVCKNDITLMNNKIQPIVNIPLCCLCHAKNQPGKKSCLMLSIAYLVDGAPHFGFITCGVLILSSGDIYGLNRGAMIIRTVHTNEETRVLSVSYP